MDVGYPEDDALADALAAEVDAMDVLVRTSVIAALERWCNPPPLPSEIDGVLNHRYDVYLVAPGDGAPHIAIVHEPGRPTGWIAAFFDGPPTPAAIASAAARAVGTMVNDYHVAS